jgi:hypothetical protein
MIKNTRFTPLEKRILNMALNDDDRLCSFYAKELFEHINLADVVRKQIRIKLARILNVGYDFVRDVIFFTERKEVIKKNGKIAPTGIYRLDKNFKSRIRSLMN